MYGMLSAIFLPAFAIAISPWSIMAMLLILESKNGIRKATFFNLGWILPLVVVSLALLVILNNTNFSEGSDPLDIIGILRLIIGVILLLLALKMWYQARDPMRIGKQPKWILKIQDMTPARTFLLGLSLFFINFKNIALVVMAMGNILVADRGLPYVVISWLVFLGLASFTHWSPVWVHRRDPEEDLISLRRWNELLSEHTVLLVIFPMIVVAFWQIEGGRMILM